METRKILLEISEELFQSIETRRGDAPRSGWIEAQLWKVKCVKDGALVAGVENPGRDMDRRGTWKRGKGRAISSQTIREE